MQLEKGFNLAGKKLMIGLPAYDHKVGVKMAISLMKLGQKLMEHGIAIQISSICGCSVVSRARNMIAHEFIKSDCDSLMFIDADMTFEAESVIRLMAWNQDRAIVAGAYEARKEGKVYILSLDGGNGVHGPQGKVTMDEVGLVKAYRVATGFMMIQRKVLYSFMRRPAFFSPIPLIPIMVSLPSPVRLHAAHHCFGPITYCFLKSESS
jgi:hypothetical protein